MRAEIKKLWNYPLHDFLNLPAGAVMDGVATCATCRVPRAATAATALSRAPRATTARARPSTERATVTPDMSYV